MDTEINKLSSRSVQLAMFLKIKTQFPDFKAALPYQAWEHINRKIKHYWINTPQL